MSLRPGQLVPGPSQQYLRSATGEGLTTQMDPLARRDRRDRTTTGGSLKRSWTKSSGLSKNTSNSQGRKDLENDIDLKEPDQYPLLSGLPVSCDDAANFLTALLSVSFSPG